MNFEHDLVAFFGVKELICPECAKKDEKYYKTKCLETRTYTDENSQPWVRRRHYCPNCLNQFYTIENIEQ